MSRNSALFDIITKIKPEDAQAILRKLRGKDKALFAFLILQKNYDEPAAMALFPTMQPSEFSSLKSRLQQRIAAHLGESRRQGLPITQLSREVYRTEGYLEASTPLGAIRHLGKIFDLTIELEEFSLLETTVILVGRLANFKKEMHRPARRLAEIEGKLETARRLQKEYLAALEWVEKSKQLSLEALEMQRTKATALLQQLPPIDAAASKKANLLLCRAHWRCAAILENHEMVRSMATAAVRSVENFESSLYSPAVLEAVLEANNVHSSELVRDSRHEEALSMISAFKLRLQSMIGYAPMEVDEKQRQLEMRLAMANLPIAKARLVLQRILGECSKVAAVPKARHMLAVIAIKYLLENALFEDAAAWLPQLAKHRAEVSPHSRVLLGFVLEIALYLARQDDIALAASLRNMQYFSRTRKCDMDLTAHLAKALKALLANGWDLIALQNALRAAPQPTNQAAYHSWFDLETFVKKLGDK